jgi:hypothetical protein
MFMVSPENPSDKSNAYISKLIDNIKPGGQQIFSLEPNQQISFPVDSFSSGDYARGWNVLPNSIPISEPFVNTSNPSAVYAVNNDRIDQANRDISFLDTTLANKLILEKLETESGKTIEEILTNPNLVDPNSQKELAKLLKQYSAEDLLALKEQDEGTIIARKSKLIAILKQFENIETTQVAIIDSNLKAISYDKNANLASSPTA